MFQVAGITMGTMFVMDKLQKSVPVIDQFTGPRKTAIQSFLDVIIFWR